MDPRRARVGERPRRPRPGRRRRSSRRRSRPGAGARPGRRAGRSPGTAAVTCGDGERARRSCRAGRARRAPTSRGGTGWRTRCPARNAALTVAAVLARGGDRRRVVGHAVQRVHEVHPRRARRARRTSGRRVARASTRFHCICGRFTPGGIHRTVPGSTPRPRAPGSSSLRVEQHLHADADAEERAARRDRGERRLLEAGARAARPCRPRTRRRRAARRRRRRRSARVGGEAGVGAAALAAPSAPSAGCRCRSRARRPAAAVGSSRLTGTPFVDGTPPAPRRARRRAGSGPGP